MKKYLYVILFVCLLQAVVQGNQSFVERDLKVIFFPIKQAVVSSLVETIVMEYKFKEGEVFEPGEVIVTLDDSRYSQIHIKMQAALKEADVNCEYTDAQVNRNKDLFKKGVIGQEELEKSKLEQSMAIAKQKAALTNMNMAKLNLDSCKIIAPFKGRLISKIAQEHEYVKAGQPVLSVIDDTRLLAVIHLPSGLKNSLKIGQEFEIKVDETGQTYKGRVHEISGEVDPGSKTFSIKLLVDNHKGVLSPGMSGTLQRAAIEQVIKNFTGKTAESAGRKK